ncbi:MAG: hypothetical protein RR945_06965 [Erysipelotrichaceae bacterium]
MKNKLLIITFVLSTFLFTFIPVNAASYIMTESEVKSYYPDSPLKKIPSTTYKYWLKLEGFTKNGYYYGQDIFFSDFPIIVTERDPSPNCSINVISSNKQGKIIHDYTTLYVIPQPDGTYEINGQYSHNWNDYSWENTTPLAHGMTNMHPYKSARVTANHSVIDNTDPTKPFFRAPLLTQETFVSLQERVAQALVVIIGGTISLVGLAVLLVVLVRHLRTFQRA